MTWLLVFAIAILALQIFLFFSIRKKKKRDRQNDITEKYNIKSASDAFRLIQDQNIPEEDRKKIELIYKGQE